MTSFWFKSATSSVVVNGSNEPIDCMDCPCDAAVDCSNCDAATTPTDYTLTFGGTTDDPGDCSQAECDRLLNDGPFVVTKVSECLYTYTSPETGCADFYIQMSLDNAAPYNGFVYIIVSMGDGTVVAVFKKAWTPPADCGSTEVTGAYTLDFFDDGLFCDFTNLTLSVSV
jgi:hypothetical protein